jgi:hypothetical protein
MTLDNVLKIVLASGSLAAGAFLTAVRARLTSTRQKNRLHRIFYLFSALVILTALITFITYRTDIFKAEPDWFAIIVLVIAVLFSLGLIWITACYLTGKHHFTTTELDPIVNKFTRDADKHNIKLLAGNLDFFGANESQMDNQSQYNCLRREGFKQIQILCTRPKTIADKFRYGKILNDFLGAELRYYRPSAADLNVRGRIKTLGNVPRLLIYNKVSAGVYEALELDTAATQGVLYTHLWNLIWDLAEVPTDEDIIEYRRLHRPINPRL